MATSNILDDITATSVRIKGNRGEIGIVFRLYRQDHVGHLRIKRNSIVMAADHVVTTMFRDDARLEAQSRNIAEISFSPTRKDLKEAVRTGGQSLIETLKPYGMARDPSFRNGNEKRLVNTCGALSALLGREIECTSGHAGLAPRIRIRWHNESEDPGFLKCLSRWFDWRKWTHRMNEGCLLLRPESMSFSPPSRSQDLPGLWLAIAGLEDPRKDLSVDASAHEILAAETRLIDETLPAALVVRDSIARTSRLSAARLERLATDMITRHRKA